MKKRKLQCISRRMIYFIKIHILKFAFVVKIVILRSVTSQGCQVPVTPWIRENPYNFYNFFPISIKKIWHILHTSSNKTITLGFYCYSCEVYVIIFFIEIGKKMFKLRRFSRIYGVTGTWQPYEVSDLKITIFTRNENFNVCILIKYIILLEMHCNFLCVIYLKYTTYSGNRPFKNLTVNYF